MISWLLKIIGSYSWKEYSYFFIQSVSPRGSSVNIYRHTCRVIVVLLLRTMAGSLIWSKSCEATVTRPFTRDDLPTPFFPTSRMLYLVRPYRAGLKTFPLSSLKSCNKTQASMKTGVKTSLQIWIAYRYENNPYVKRRFSTNTITNEICIQIIFKMTLGSRVNPVKVLCTKTLWYKSWETVTEELQA